MTYGDFNQENNRTNESRNDVEPVFLTGTEKRSSRRRSGIRSFKIIVGIIFVMALVVASSMFYRSHDIVYSAGDDGIRFSISPRTPGNPAIIPPSANPPRYPEMTPAVNNNTNEDYLQNQPTDDGTKLIIPEPPGIHGDIASQAMTIKQIARKVKPSVVGIVSEVRASSGFGTPQTGTSTGTGIIMDAAGYIITNCHVIDEAVGIKVLLDNSNEYDAVLIGKDKVSDLAVIRINASEMLTPAEFGNSDILEVGDIAVAIGNPLGIELRGTVTDGIISAINRDFKIDGRNMTLLQTNAALNAGNSGGPLINEYGQVIGINTAKVMTNYYETVEGLGFAIPINTAAPIVNSLIEDGYVKGRPAIGITGEDIPQAAANYYKMPQGVYVRTVNPDSDAYKKGVVEGDIIIGINGQPTVDSVALNKIKDTFSAGDKITLNIYRNDSNIDIEIILADVAELS